MKKRTHFLAPTTVTQSRIAIFAPTIRARADHHAIIKNSWGEVEVSGDLNQLHRSILDFLISHEGLNWERKEEAGKLYVRFPHTGMLRLLGYNAPGSDGKKWLEDQFEKLRKARFRVTTSKGHINSTANVGIIEKHAHAFVGDICVGYGVVISAEYMWFYRTDVHCHTEQYTDKIVAIRSGALQAVIRFCLSHKNGYKGSFLDVLQALGINGDDRLKRAKTDAKKYNATLARDFGILYDPSSCQLVYERRNDVFFTRPLASRNGL